ncbi:MAG: PD-(D/E)XK motif protein [Steroidobacteraceae bacterium]
MEWIATMMTDRTSIPTIEELWQSLRSGPTIVHRRVDATHPLELYAEFAPPDRHGLVLFTHREPPEPRPLRSLHIDRGRRPDGLWWLRLSISGTAFQAVFAGLCHDIISTTRTNVTDDIASAVILSRVGRWRKLLEGELRGMSKAELRGLIGELVILERDVMSVHRATDAVMAWNGPFGSAQDFTLPTGQRIEVKAIRSDSASCQINGLDQLDSATDPLTLTVVRLDETGVHAEGAMTASTLVERLRDRLAEDPEALNEFNSRLAAAGWHNHPDHQNFAVLVVGIEHHAVDASFPRLIRGLVPQGVLEARYDIALPPASGPDNAGAGRQT